MASEPKKDQEQRDGSQEHAANVDATHREAYEYWGYLLQEDKCGTPILNRLLKGIAEVVVSRRDSGAQVTMNPSADHDTAAQQVRA
jgi:hypothetical protein